MAGKKDSTGGATRKGEAERAIAGVGGIRSSEENMPDLFWSGENMEERRMPLVAQEGRARKDGVTAREGYQRPIKFGNGKSSCIGKRKPNRVIGFGVCMEKCNAPMCCLRHGGV